MGVDFTGSVAGLPVDMGGAFVGLDLDAVLALVAELETPTMPATHHDGKTSSTGVAGRGYWGTIPKLSLTVVRLTLAGRVGNSKELPTGIPVDAPWCAHRARELDGLRSDSGCALVRATASSRAT